MASYLELDELVENETYRCETYDGVEVFLTYVGDGMFLGDLSVYGEIRYVFPD